MGIWSQAAAMMLALECQATADTANLEEGYQGVEVGLRFDAAVKRVHHRVWRKYGHMEISAAKLRARKLHTKAVSQHIKARLASIGKLVNQKEHEIEKSKKVDDEIAALREKISDRTEDMNADSARIEEGARKAEARASKLLMPTYRAELGKEAVAAAGMKRLKKEATKSVLDAARTASDESNVELLANIAEQAEKQTRQYVHASEEKAAQLKKTAAKAELKLKRAVDKKKLAIEKDIAKDEKTAAKVNLMMKKAQSTEKRAVKAEQKAKQAAVTGKTQALKALETAKATKKLAGGKPKLKKAHKTKSKKANTSVAAKAEAKAEAKAKKSAKVEKKAEQMYKIDVRNLDKAKRVAQQGAKRAKRVATKAARARDRLTEKLDRDRVRLTTLSALTEQYRSKSITASNPEPLTKEKNQLMKDEAYVNRVKEEAQAVKKRARRHIKNRLARKIDQNLLLQKEVSKLKSELKGEKILLKAEKKKEAPASEREALARAQVDRDAARKEMKIAEKEQRAVVDKEKLAATNIIASMKTEIKRQVAAQKKNDADRDSVEKKMLADARALLIRARAVSGASLKSESKKIKEEAAAAKKNVKFDKMSMKDLVAMVRKQYLEAKKTVDEDAKVADSGASNERVKQILADAKKQAANKKYMKKIMSKKKSKAKKNIAKQKKQKAEDARKAAAIRKKIKADEKDVETKAAKRAEKREKKAAKKAKRDAKNAAAVRPKDKAKASSGKPKKSTRAKKARL